MLELSFTLISDGSSDRALVPLLKWVLVQNGVRVPVLGDWVNWGRFRTPPKDLTDKIKRALDWYPCHLLFIHRDAEGVHPVKRKQEISRAVQRLSPPDPPPCVSIVPVRMMEAWLLFDEQAIREASGNPNSRCSLEMPRLNSIESLPDPKNTLHELLRDASELVGRRRRHFRVGPAVHRMADIVEDFSPLRNLPAFRALEEDVRSIILKSGWSST